MATKIVAGLADAWHRTRTDLARDALFTGPLVGKHRFAAMDALIAQPPASWERLFEDVAAAEPADRWAGLALASRHAKADAIRIEGPLRLLSAPVRFFAGDVVVTGDVELGPGSVLVAAGDLVIEGNLIGDAADYSLAAAGGTLRARAVHTVGELLARKAIAITGPAWFAHNDYYAVSPKLGAKILIQDDRDDQFGRITAPRHWAGRLSSADAAETLAGWLGLDGFDDAEELARAFRDRLLADHVVKPKLRVPPASAQQAMVEAAEAQSTKRLRSALDSGANPASVEGAAALVCVCSAGNLELVEMLLAAGAEPDRRDPNGWVALIAGAGRVRIVKALLRAGADPKIRDNEGPALNQAWRAADCLTALLAAGADPAATDDVGRTALHIVAQSGNAPEIKALVRGHAPLEARDEKGRTALWLACQRGWAPVAKTLIAAGADPNASDHEGRTPLFAVASSTARIDLTPLVRLLLRSGASPEARDRNGKTAAQIASKARGDVIAALR